MRNLVTGLLLAFAINSNAQTTDSVTTVSMIQVPDSFANRMQGRQLGVNVFNYIRGVDEHYYCSPNAATDFYYDFFILEQSGWAPDTVEKHLYEFKTQQ